MFIPSRLTSACVVATLAFALAPTAAHAQFSGNTTYDAGKHAYFVTGDATLSGDVSDNEIFVGKDNATSFTTQPGSYTLTLESGATTTFYGNPYPGSYYTGLYVFGNHNLVINNGATVRAAVGCDTSTTNISNVNVFSTFGNGSSTMNINSSTTVEYMGGFDNATYNINNGATVYRAVVYSTCTTNISGGTFTSGFLLNETTPTVNFVGTDLSFAYQSYDKNNAYYTYSDFFQITGTFSGETKTYNLYVRNSDEFNSPQTPDSTPRQFTFNGMLPVVVPESSTLALALPALATVGVVVVRRRKASNTKCFNRGE